MNNIIVRGTRTVGGDFFTLIKSRGTETRDKPLSEYYHLFNFDDYWCLKTTGKQRLINKEDFLDFKYSGYTFLKKDLYDIEKVLEWVEYFNGFGGIQYLSKPTPPFSPTKIKIMK